MLLYGREMRLPAQLGTEPSSSSEPQLDAADASGLTDYALRLHRHLTFAWQAAHDASRAAQGADAAETARTSHPQEFRVDDRVARRLYGAANKLEYLYSGPYRIEAVLGDGRYRLRDLENGLIFDEFDVSNLRPYRTRVDAEELQPDEFVVEYLMKHRGSGVSRQFLVKWRGYPQRSATWLPRNPGRN